MGGFLNESDIKGLAADLANKTNVYSVKNYGAKGDGTTDDTTAIQNCINAVNSAGGGVVYFPIGIYIIGGALNGTTNSQISFPLNAYSSSTAVTTIKLVGEMAPNDYSEPIYSQALPNTGVILKSTLSGAGNIIGSFSGSTVWGNFNYLNVNVENIRVRINSKSGSTDISPAATAFNFSNVTMCSFKNVAIDTMSNQYNSVKPTYGCNGIVLPLVNNFVMIDLDKIFITGVYSAIVTNEHTNMDNIFLDAVYEGLVMNGGYHPVLVNRICIARCNTAVAVNAVTSFQINQLAIETNSASKWFDTVFHLDERVLGSQANIRYNIVVAGVGVSNNSFIRSTYAQSQIIADSIGFTSELLNINNQSSAYTLQKTDFNSIININNASAQALNIPAMSSVKFPIGTRIAFSQQGAGAVNITGASGVTIQSASSQYSTNGQYAKGEILKTGFDTWMMSGNLVSNGSGGSGTATGWDSDTQAFIYAAAITDATTQSAINTLVTSLKSAGLWSLMSAIYPMVGGCAYSCSINLINPSTFQLKYVGAQIFDSKGYHPDGTSSWASTGVIPSSAFSSVNSGHMCFYSLTSAVNGGGLMGQMDGFKMTRMQLNQSNVNYSSMNSAAFSPTYTAPANLSGIWLLNRNNSANETIYHNGTLYGTATYTTQGLGTYPIAIGGLASGTNPLTQVGTLSNIACGYCSIGNGVADADRANYSTIIQTFLTALSR